MTDLKEKEGGRVAVQDQQELDELLSECKSLIDQTQQKPDAMTAEDVEIDYQKFYDGEFPQQPESPRPLTAYEQSKPAYQSAKRQANALRREAQKAQRAQRIAEQKQKLQEAPSPSADGEEFSNWLYEQGQDEQTSTRRLQAQKRIEQMTQDGACKKQKKKRKWPWFLAVAVALAVAWMIVCRQPAYPDSSHTRLPDTATILLCGTDEGGLRTDTILLMRISGKEHAIRLVSIPRDTLVLGNYAVPKINSAYGYGGGKDEGMEELLLRVSQTIGFRPDGYLLISLEGLEKLVDVMGGVRYSVPMPMQYTDPAQDLYINLKAGEQNLSGKQAVQLVRFRSGYAQADLQRVAVQRSFMQEAMRQWSSPLRWVRYPAAMAVLANYCESDLSLGNYLWLGTTALSCTKDFEMQTLPGNPMMIAGGSYYVLNAEAVAETVNDYLNPFEQPILVSDLTIRNG